MPALNFQKQFADLVENGEKRQTIRAERKDGRRPATPGAPISLYTGMRTKSCRRLMIAQYASLARIIMQRTHDGRLDIAVAADPDRPIYWTADAETMARDDGFPDAAAMLAWFENTHGLPFQGWLIKWDPPAQESPAP